MWQKSNHDTFRVYSFFSANYPILIRDSSVQSPAQPYLFAFEREPSVQCYCSPHVVHLNEDDYGDGDDAVGRIAVIEADHISL